MALADIATQLVAQLAPSVRLVVDPSLLRPVEIPVSRGSYDKLHADGGLGATDHTRHVSLEDIVDDLVARRHEI